MECLFVLSSIHGSCAVLLHFLLLIQPPQLEIITHVQSQHILRTLKIELVIGEELKGEMMALPYLSFKAQRVAHPVEIKLPAFILLEELCECIEVRLLVPGIF